MEQRKSNIELLRILAMLMIVANHYAGHGVMLGYSEELNRIVWRQGSLTNQLISCSLYVGGAVGVAIFFMISGFFQSQNDDIRLKKVCAETYFYSWICLLIAICLFGLGYEFYGIGKASLLINIPRSVFIPVSSKMWWFVTSYVLLCLMHPLINRLFNNLEWKNQGIFLSCFWLLGYLFAILCENTFMELQKAVFFYLVGSYIGHTVKTYRLGSLGGWKRIFFVLVTIIGWVLSTLLMYAKFIHIKAYSSIMDQLYVVIWGTLNDSITVVMCSVSIFVLFLQTDIGYSKAINSIAKTTFGVYLLHNNPYMRPLIWHTIFQVDTVQYKSEYFILLAIITICVVFTICSMFDLIRIRFFERKMIEIIDRIGKRIGVSLD